MIKIIKERTPETIVTYTIEFENKDNPNAGFCFPATSYGEPDFAMMSDEAIQNFKKCLIDDRLTEAEFKVDKHTYMNPAIGKCICGAEVVLDSGYMGAVQCECGKWYNLFGQELRDPKYWEEDYDY
jgi:hypothetical protein